ncbi:MAG TPA: Na(+)/H(+) antiporter subunit D [Rhodospirillales bacterium]|mgnify:CR=1 FL=1|nr:Na(+)/H(+) antiporter subunit D [Rhodospirillales bacterium]
MIDSLPPWVVLFAAALLLPWCRGSGLARSVVLLLAPLAALALIWSLADGQVLAFEYLGMTLVPLRVDALARLFATIFAIMAFAGCLFSLNQRSTAEPAAACVYAGSAIGVALAGDLITLLVFWELMALASTAIIWSAGTPASFRAAGRYLMIHLLGGMVLTVGIVAHVFQTGAVAFNTMPDGTASLLVLAGFLINAAAWPISAWLPDAYPEASWSGTVFLSAFTTKAAVYAMLRGYPGAEILVPIGLVMIFYGIIYALLENDMRRILAYSIVNQVGFMVTGIGIGTEMALNGAAAHAFAHIIYKALLLMSAGSVLLATGRRKCSELGGLFQSMPLTTICGIIGALSISAFPLTSGFVTKSMINQAAGDEGMAVAWLLLMAASAGVFLHAGIKFPWFVFFQKDSGLRPPDPPWNMRAAMVLFAGLCIGIGVFPAPLYAILPFPVDYAAYTAPHVLEMLQLLLFSGLAFFVLLPLMKRTETISLDTDWGYRKLLPALLGLFARVAVPVDAAVRRGTVSGLWRLKGQISRHTGPAGAVARTLTAGNMVVWVVLMLVGYLVAYFLSR